MQIETLLLRTSAMLTRIASHADFTLSNPATFNTTLTSCLTSPTFSFPNGQVMGLCCSSLLSLQFLDPDSSSADDLMAGFRRFLLAASLIRCGWTGGIPQCDLLAAEHVSGYRLMKRLDRIVTPQFLSACSKEAAQVLFLLVLGAALSVSPTMSLSKEGRQTPPPPPGLDKMADDLVRSPTLYLTVKEKLCRMVADHLARLGSSLGIRLDTGMEQRSIDMATVTWNTMEWSVWGATQHGGTGKPEIQSQPKAQASTSGGCPGEGNQPWISPSYHWGMEEPPPSLPTFPGPTSAIRSVSPETTNSGSEPHGDWDANPQSYLDMVMEDEPHLYENSTTSLPGGYNWQRSNTDPSPRREYAFDGRKGKEQGKTRRTIWLVRPFDGGPEKGQINQHTRLRGDMESRDFLMHV